MGEHNHNAKKIGWTILLNIVITLAEYIGGIFSGSLALLSDAGHNLSDVISLILGYFGEKISGSKASKRHSFGFKRTEIFTALINALSLWAIAIFIVIEGIKRLSSNDNISVGLMLGIALIGLFGNLFSILILNKDKDHNLNMKAAYLHLFYDTVSSVAVIISGIIIYYTNFIILDVIISFFIALMIIYSGFSILKRCIHIFMQGVPEGIDFEDVFKKIGRTKGIKSAHNLHIWSINSNESFLSCHICTDNKKKDSDNIIKSVNTMLKKDFGIEHTTIQIENNNMCKDGMVCCK
ncbi:cation transporter [Candidatus Pacearchaeota archaeon]|nr:cation transporter [Candidatus Pacearchaeota archaeon]